ncbi:MAG TPA: hypothetical protein VK927_10790 [Adhaeribacter sp.]|nr:hypothetical protein [Adhaeribacter sp.]
MNKKEKINRNLEYSLEFLNAVIQNPAILDNVKNEATLNLNNASNSIKPALPEEKPGTTLKVA